jgi:formylglycine-generating enzyme required for sulfatase activity
LLTEAEYEYAARAGSTTTYFWGDKIDCGKASYDGGPGSNCAAHGWFSLRGTQLVGTYSANRWGLHDMLGNVWEWCEDNWHPDYHGAPNDGSAWRGGMRPRASCAAGHGITAQAGFALLTETGSLPTGALPSWASVSRDNLIRRWKQKCRV